MLIFTVRRLLGMIPTLLLISVVCFVVIKLQPGSYTDQFLEDPRFTKETVERLTQQLGLNDPAWMQYAKWLWGVVSRGDFGYSFDENRPVATLILEPLGVTVLISGLSLALSWLIAVPLGIYTAFNRRGIGAQTANFFGYFGLAIPDFLAALFLIALVLRFGGTNVGGLNSPDYIGAPLSWGKILDTLGHLWIPLLALGLEGVASVMRQMRASTLDVLSQDYVRTAKAKGLAPRVVVWRHAVRNAINPLISLAGLSLPALISGTIIVSVVLNLPTIGPILYESLINKDQYVALTMLMLSATLLLIGNLLADIALALTDPRVRYS
ncbi:ABC transporter permease [Deinococcus yavapaiensis]|uniref:Peptide/nickel transport system permease protein n=1 Tax=Deinococcus yavapaiensis KR-236 TaxID=694435 RepID=A0A318S762_9DEIO|nr:ABC transporter permease [Deinococcus yavapaiensis]PYE54151.1 peptide/nickel transport system permease protein [Deinococcus yavapaiensis KR-236]